MKRILSVIVVATCLIPNGVEAGKIDAVGKAISECGKAAYKTATKGGKAAGKEAGRMDWASRNAGMAAGRWISSNKKTEGSKPCHDCGGDGKSWLKTCKTCNGSGSIKWMAD